MATWNSYDLVGKKEDVSDVISNLTPRKTPFQTMIGGEKTKQTVFSWQEDELAQADGASQGRTEGFDATDNAITPTWMRENVTQIFEKTIKVAATTDAVSTYGRAKESAYQMAKKSAEAKRDMEDVFVGTGQEMVKPTDNTAARKMAGYQAMIHDDLISYTGATTNPLTESILLTNLQKQYDEGADPNTIMVTPSNSLVIADFAKASGRSRDFGSKKSIVNVVDLYVSPFGEQKVVLNRFLKTGDTLTFDPANWKKVTLRGWTRETLAKTGDALRMMLVGEFSLKHKNFKASGLIREDAAPV